MTASSTEVKRWSGPRCCRNAPCLRSWWTRCEARAIPRVTPRCLELDGQVPQRLQPGVVDVGHAVGVEDHRVHRGWTRRRRGGGPAAGGSRRCRTTGGRRPGTPGRRGPARSGVPMSTGIQWSVPGSRPRTASRGRADRRVRSASDRTMATTTPCSMPTRATTTRVTAASANSSAVEAQDRPQLADPEQLGGDEHQGGAQRRLRQVGERRGRHQHHDQDHDRGHDVGELRPGAGRGRDRRVRRAGVDRERPDEPGGDAAGPDADQVPVEVVGCRRHRRSTPARWPRSGRRTRRSP